ncbi:sulfur carrier protein ThiS [bacterium]|nr:MAG: sulfur carrier protein ThiS [bacterium]
MEIVLNGEQRKFDGPLTIGELLKELDVDPDTVVVERNLNILSRDDHAGEPVEDGDTVEIIQMVDGG